ncbi:hypothetical protein ACNKHV_24150 [Shigella flexneri]
MNAALMMHALAAARRVESPRNCTARYRRPASLTRLEGECQVPIGSYAELLMVELRCVRWSARRTVRRLFAVNAAVRRKMPNKWGFQLQKSY